MAFLTHIVVFTFCVAKKSRHSPDTVEELNLLFPKGCDIMGIATPGIVCKCFCVLSSL